MFSLMLLAGGWQTGAWWYFPPDGRDGLTHLRGRFYAVREVAVRQYGLPRYGIAMFQQREDARQSNRERLLS